MTTPKPRYKDPSMQKCYEEALTLAADLGSEFYYNGEQHRGAGHRCAFWDGYNGVEQTPHAIPGTMSWAFFQAGKEFARCEKPLKVTKKPTRRDLLRVVTELQALISKGSSLHANDRNPHGFEQGQKVLQEAFELCLAARSFDSPTDLESN